MRENLIRWATYPPADRLWGWASRGGVPIFMLHRFRPDRSDGPGVEESFLYDTLRLLQARGFALLALDDAVQSLLEGKPVGRSVVFTVDDGYHDFASIGLPVFRECRCPVTVFLTTGFIDGHWMWWDRITALFATTARTTITIHTGTTTLRFDRVGRAWSPGASELAAHLKTIPDDTRCQVLGELEDQCRVQLPKTPPPQFASMTWETIADAAAQGISFGAHTVTHPILSRTGTDHAHREIHGSWEQLRMAVPPAALSRVFCYPNGQPDDFTHREERTLQDHGFLAGVTTTPGYAGILNSTLPEGRFRIPRFAFPASRSGVLQIVTGLEAIKMRYRRRLGSVV